jgi:hypothetical protein
MWSQELLMWSQELLMWSTDFDMWTMASTSRSYCLSFLLIVQSTTGWVLPVSRSAVASRRTTTCRRSTLFEADFYDNPNDKDNANLKFGPSSLAVPLDTNIILGLSKYSHDASACAGAADAATGKVLFALAKERTTRIV